MEIKQVVAIAKALSDPHRVRALMALRGGELCVCQIIELLGLSPSSVSRHMTLLRDAGLLESRKDSRWVYYRFADEQGGNESTFRLLTTLAGILEKSDDVMRDDARLPEITGRLTAALCDKSER